MTSEPRTLVHFGVGNFHRAHQAWYTQRLNNQIEEPWSIVGVSLVRPYMRDAMQAQSFDYTLLTKDSSGTQAETVSAIDRILVAAENPDSVVDAIASPSTTVVTLTITEKGYHVCSSDGGLDTGHASVARELESVSTENPQPETALGYLVFGLLKRMEQGGGPLTIISCDNLSDNGRVLEGQVRTFASLVRPELVEFLDSSVSFPNTMVDRIVPATTPDLVDEVYRLTGKKDAAPVSTEAFSEWVIEKRFAGNIPRWDLVGATFVDDVSGFEMRKLSLLNGAHSLLAYGGLLSGHRYVHEAIADEQLRNLAMRLMEEATETLPSSIKGQTSDYQDALFERFANPSLKHELSQVAMDGSLKLPLRIIPTLQNSGKEPSKSAAFLALVYWLAFVLTSLRLGEKISDPVYDDLLHQSSSGASEETLLQFLIDRLGGELPSNALISETFQMLEKLD